jgi:phospholipid/cholesterol/gamma-HCH transport system substrate-binding protein
MGLVLAAAIGAIAGLAALAGGGPGFLSNHKSVTVVFRDGQGIRPGNLVRVAGIDAGSVTSVDLTEVDGILRARVKLSMSADLVARLRHDVKIAIQPSLTGQSCVNVVSSGKSAVALVPGETIEGVESSFFDPVLEQVGLGPVERKHLSHTIAQVRETVDNASPRLQNILGGLQDTVTTLRETTESVGPAVETSVGRLEEIAKRIDSAQIQDTLAKLNHATGNVDAILTENRPAIGQTLNGVKDLSVSVKGLVDREGPKVGTLLTGLNGTRAKVDSTVQQAGLLTAQANDLLTKNRANIDRSFANVKDATDFGVKLVGKLYGNPFYLSPLYKPSKEDVKAQEVYDAANTFMLGAKELNDTVTSLKAIQAKGSAPMTREEKDAFYKLFNRAWQLSGQMEQTSQVLAEGLRETNRR